MKVFKILLVDDDQDFLRMAQLSLGNTAKWKVYLANCGTQAISVAKNIGPDLILLDVVMPDMDGVATLSELRQHAELALIPVIFISATMHPDEAANYVAMGACGLINKPCDPRRLPEEIARILRSRE
ncbi:MAG TPA: response regulator [Candidatus Obscuribacterales bacterium]